MDTLVNSSVARSYQFKAPVYELPPDFFVGGQVALFDIDATLRRHFGGTQPESEGYVSSVGLFVAHVALTTMNPFASRSEDMSHLAEDIYGPRLMRVGRRMRLLTKLHPDLYRMIADTYEVETDNMRVVDNSYLAGLRAAERAGCQVAQVRPLRSSPVPDAIRPVQRLDRLAHRMLGDPIVAYPDETTLAA